MSARAHRGKLATIRTIVLFEGAFYAAVTPLLPTLQREMGLSDAGAAAVVAGYPIGMCVAALPAGLLAARRGPRVAVGGGLALIAVASLWFAFANSPEMLQLARALQGVGGALTWTGSVSWVVAEAPAGRDATAIGGALAAVLVGVLVGPLVGFAAVAVGRGLVFSVVAFIAVALGVLGALLAPASGDRGDAMYRLGHALGSRGALVAIWVTALIGIMIGSATTLAPLRLDDLGVGARAITAVFVVGGLLQAIGNPIAGRVTDRAGADWLMRAGLFATAFFLVALALDLPWTVVAALFVSLLTGAGILLTPALTVLTRDAERRTVAVATAVAASNLGWSVGEAVGAFGAGWLGGHVFRALPYALLAAACAATVVGSLRRRAAA